MPTVVDLSVVEPLFISEATTYIPSLEERFSYKKDPGSSDTRHEKDEIRR